MNLLRFALALVGGAVCFAGGLLYRALSEMHASIRFDRGPDGKVSGVSPQHFGNRDNRAIAAAICHGEQLIEDYAENITVAGGADFLRFSCAK